MIQKIDTMDEVVRCPGVPRPQKPGRQAPGRPSLPVARTGPGKEPGARGPGRNKARRGYRAWRRPGEGGGQARPGKSMGHSIFLKLLSIL